MTLLGTSAFGLETGQYPVHPQSRTLLGQERDRMHRETRAMVTDDGLEMTHGNRFCERKREKAQLNREDTGSIMMATGEDEGLHASGEDPG